MSVHFDSYTEARAHLKDLLDAATRGRVATIRRDGDRVTLVDAERLRYYLSRVVPYRAEVVAEDGGWSVFIPGVPVSADASTFDGAIEEMVRALREYAEDWEDHLLDAANHQENWGLVQLIALSDDEQLAAWVRGEAR
ncbi:prevent-host-death protein [Thermoactinospora rubra]|uniref:prevent-host-death protein n=1 Tax=Thermoactinospora rubra TaxID=1088767 RepID=UPI000A114FC7|nr:prevent-host-death protein [Thermoactinospora rubra]